MIAHKMIGMLFLILSPPLRVDIDIVDTDVNRLVLAGDKKPKLNKNIVRE